MPQTIKIKDEREGQKNKNCASLKCFLGKLKQKNIFNEIEYDKLYPSGSAPARVYGTPKIHKFSSNDSCPKLHQIVSSIGNFNYNLACFHCDLLSPLVPNDCSSKDTFFLFLKLRMQIFPKSLFPTMSLVFLLIFHFKKPLI